MKKKKIAFKETTPKVVASSPRSLHQNPPHPTPGAGAWGQLGEERAWGTVASSGCWGQPPWGCTISLSGALAQG